MAYREDKLAKKISWRFSSLISAEYLIGYIESKADENFRHAFQHLALKCLYMIPRYEKEVPKKIKEKIGLDNQKLYMLKSRLEGFLEAYS